MVQLLAVSLVLGLMLVSLDITPGSLLGAVTDIGPSLQSLGGGLWRTGEILGACLLAGGAIVVPAWLIHRHRQTQRSTMIATPDLDRPQSVQPPAAAKRS